jgi:hypothetical protein
MQTQTHLSHNQILKSVILCFLSSILLKPTLSCSWPSVLGPQGLILADTDILVDIDGQRASAFLGKVADFGPCPSKDVNPIPFVLAQSVSGKPGIVRRS